MENSVRGEKTWQEVRFGGSKLSSVENLDRVEIRKRRLMEKRQAGKIVDERFVVVSVVGAEGGSVSANPLNPVF